MKFKFGTEGMFSWGPPCSPITQETVSDVSRSGYESMNDENRLSDLGEELPPQGIRPQTQQFAQLEKIEEIAHDYLGGYVTLYTEGENLCMTAAKSLDSFDKHGTDSLMWGIHWILGDLEVEFKLPSLEESVNVAVEVRIPLSRFGQPTLERDQRCEKNED